MKAAIEKRKNLVLKQRRQQARGGSRIQRRMQKYVALILSFVLGILVHITAFFQKIASICYKLCQGLSAELQQDQQIDKDKSKILKQVDNKKEPEKCLIGSKNGFNEKLKVSNKMEYQSEQCTLDQIAPQLQPKSQQDTQSCTSVLSTQTNDTHEIYKTSEYLGDKGIQQQNEKSTQTNKDPQILKNTWQDKGVSISQNIHEKYSETQGQQITDSETKPVRGTKTPHPRNIAVVLANTEIQEDELGQVLKILKFCTECRISQLLLYDPFGNFIQQAQSIVNLVNPLYYKFYQGYSRENKLQQTQEWENGEQLFSSVTQYLKQGAYTNHGGYGSDARSPMEGEIASKRLQQDLADIKNKNSKHTQAQQASSLFASPTPHENSEDHKQDQITEVFLLSYKDTYATILEAIKVHNQFFQKEPGGYVPRYKFLRRHSYTGYDLTPVDSNIVLQNQQDSIPEKVDLQQSLDDLQIRLCKSCPVSQEPTDDRASPRQISISENGCVQQGPYLVNSQQLSSEECSNSDVSTQSSSRSPIISTERVQVERGLYDLRQPLVPFHLQEQGSEAKESVSNSTSYIQAFRGRDRSLKKGSHYDLYTERAPMQILNGDRTFKKQQLSPRKRHPRLVQHNEQQSGVKLPISTPSKNSTEEMRQYLNLMLVQAGFQAATTDVDYVMVFGQILILAGLPPWQVRTSEIYCLGNLSNLKYNSLIEVYQKYRGTYQRFGK